jgi:hypothetical protein
LAKQGIDDRRRTRTWARFLRVAAYSTATATKDTYNIIGKLFESAFGGS